MAVLMKSIFKEHESQEIANTESNEMSLGSFSGQNENSTLEKTEKINSN